MSTPTTPVPTRPRAGGLRVSSRGAVRRLQALHHCGYDVDDLAPMISWSDTIIEQLLTTPPQTILASSHQLVTKVFKQLRDIPATANSTRIAAAKQRADSNNWAGPFDWDNLDTDEKPVHRRSQTHDELEAGVSREKAGSLSRAVEFNVKAAQNLLVDAEPDDSEALADPAPQSMVLAEPDHSTMTDVQKRTHYQNGCRNEVCRAAKNEAVRRRKAEKLTAVKADAIQDTGPIGDAQAALDTSEPTESAPPAPPKTGMTGSTREQYLEQHVRTLEGELSDVFAGRDVLLGRLADLRTEFADQTELLEQMVQVNEKLTTTGPAAAPAVDPRDEQLILLVSQVGELERDRESLTNDLAFANQVIADELDYRDTLLAQVRALQQETTQAPGSPVVTVTVYVGGVRIA